MACLERIAAQYPPEVVWTIAFDGRKLGEVTAWTPKEFSLYSHIGLQEIVSTGPVPTVGKRSSDFAGFASEAAYRPLVAISQPFYADPEAWKPAPQSAEHVKLLRRAFRQQFPHLCKALKEDEATLKPFAYADENIHVVKSYGSSRGWTVAGLHLEGATDCQDTEQGFALSDPWFVIEPENSVQFLGQDIWLVDAGDYDNDGRSELIFAVAGYNRGGYRIFYDDFQKHASFEYSYH